MVIANRVMELFADAKAIQDSALERLDQEIFDAAEKAWCATKLATDALILSRTDEEPEKTPRTSAMLNRLASHIRDAGSLCDPIDETERRIRETIIYIRDAELLALTS